MRPVCLALLALFLAIPAIAQSDSREQAMADLYLKVCFANDNSYNAVVALAKSSGWESIDPSAAPFPTVSKRPGPPKEAAAWKVNGFVLYAAPKALFGGAGAVRDLCSFQSFDMDRARIIPQLLTEKRLIDLQVDHPSVYQLMVNPMKPEQLGVLIMKFKPQPRDRKEGRHEVMVIQSY